MSAPAPESLQARHKRKHKPYQLAAAAPKYEPGAGQQGPQVQEACLPSVAGLGCIMQSMADALVDEARGTVECAAFLNKRSPSFTGH